MSDTQEEWSPLFTFSIVGSRGTSAEMNDKLFRYVYALVSIGGRGTSGAADGPDHQLTKVAEALVGTRPGCQMAKIYLPWSGFNGWRHGDLDGMMIDAKKMPNHEEARRLAEGIHGGWKYLTDGGKLLHTRNMYQPLQDDLNSPVDFMLLAAPVDKWGKPKGGTASAWLVGHAWMIPRFNLELPGEEEKFIEHVQLMLEESDWNEFCRLAGLAYERESGTIVDTDAVAMHELKLGRPMTVRPPEEIGLNVLLKETEE